MEFGRVDTHLLQSIDLSLAPEPVWNQQFLGKPNTHTTQLYLGCAKWGRPEWVGKIYPPKTKEKDYLQHYVQHYNSIELNATHYKVYDAATVAKWKAKAAGRSFLFCPKMYQGVTHRGSLQGKDALTTAFLAGVLAFEEHLGPIFIQVSEYYAPTRKADLFAYLASLPTDLTFFVEVRHPDWFAQPEHWNDLLVHLRQMNIGLVITDAAGRRDCCHMHLTIPKVFIRYVGNSLHPTDYTRADAWMQRMHYWMEQGIESIYFFMHMHDETYSPELTVYMVDAMNNNMHTHLIKPTFQNNTLF
ncbi:MAG TPA: DUF72 domain-containing protein [Chitinophagaceae bacterium]|nr:DUF72 domain-containing protein [Chitinophagaceae bacterium]